MEAELDQRLLDEAFEEGQKQARLQAKLEAQEARVKYATKLKGKLTELKGKLTEKEIADIFDLSAIFDLSLEEVQTLS